MMNRKMLKQAQQLQKRMEQMQEEMETLTVEGSAGGGAVTATVTGKMHVLSITIDPDVVDPDDVDLLQDMVLAAVNDGLHRAEETVSKQMASLTGGLKIPGLM
jgi:DNA-binding YbaB/EbfC family protein